MRRRLDTKGTLQTVSVRGTFVLNAFDFVCERYSPAAHATVLRMRPALRTALSAVRENSWTPLEDLVAYMETAKAVLAPGDPGFYKKMGFYGGSHVRVLPVGIAVSEQTRALRLYGMLWRTFFDAGDLEEARSCEFAISLRRPPSASVSSARWKASSVWRRCPCESRSEPAPAVETPTARCSSRGDHRGRGMSGAIPRSRSPSGHTRTEKPPSAPKPRRLATPEDRSTQAQVTSQGRRSGWMS
ncbi:MAG: hypothetical protein DMD91_02080 [Candidatus Rokuibacteriota bacterium]|nr:MAG: hypothetical protein DMD91_02080 [Candidatus Rokubacteria bacterium]